MFRSLTLTLGPVLIVGTLYGLLRPDFGHDASAASRGSAAPANAAGPQSPRAPSIEALCRDKGARVAELLGTECRVIVRAPFVLAGDFAERDLERHYRDTVVPTARALFVSYFDRPPTEPITILLFSGDDAYRRYAEQIDGNPRTEYSGYYQRDERRVVVNVATGNGTLAHELTHALAQFDFPEMPEWFDEGLASLHEQSDFSDDGLQIIGTSNWRLHFLLPAVRDGSLQPLEALLASRRVRPQQEAVDYAHARYLCLFLQRKGLLAPFYRKFRETVGNDPAGKSVLCQLIGVASVEEVDREFREWVLALHRGGR